MEMALAAERFIKCWCHNKGERRLTVLAGKTGCGKTHTLDALYEFAQLARTSLADMGFWGWPPSIWLTRWPERARALIENKTPMAEILQDSRTADILFLDDIGSESDKFKTGEVNDALCQLLSARERKWTFITTNVEEPDWTKRFDARIADRLHRGAEIVDLSKARSYSV